LKRFFKLAQLTCRKESFLQQPPESSSEQHLVLHLAHSSLGQIRTLRIPHRVLKVLGFVLLFSITLGTGMAFSYARMWWKVSNFNSLRDENTRLKARYEGLRRENQKTEQQLASFQVLATEITQAYGIQRNSSVMTVSLTDPLIPSVGDSLQRFRFLREADLSRLNRRGLSALTLEIQAPTLWPTTGRLTSFFGVRNDPFSGEGAFHSGIDIATFYGAPARAAANGVVTRAEYMSGYGNVVVVDHRNGFETYYGHLARATAIPGQEVRQGQVIGLCGSTGRSTGVHLHYEVRRGGVPINPYPYLARAFDAPQPIRKDFNF
jgi:murein DD-endopeptidase MepM/ murein hydrolase activator NlpD